jgi:very-short-patch-repair endonuclease/predicted transcriptional regulator of viral defense system
VRRFPAHIEGKWHMSYLDRALHALAERQYGIVSRAQALRLGLSVEQVAYRLSTGRLVGAFPGVYRVAGAPPSGRQRAFAASLWLGDTALVSHMTAATLLRLDGCKTIELHVSVPRDLRRRTQLHDVRVHRVVSLPRADRVLVDGIPCTSATRTLVDCAARLGAEPLEVAFESARRMGLSSPDALATSAADVIRLRRPGSNALRELLSHQQRGEVGLQFRLEVKMARLLRTSSLPRPERQVHIGPYFIDFGYCAQLVGVECEGFEFHGTRLAWKRDKRRTAWLERQGWRLVFVTWEDVTKHPQETLDRIAIALGMRAA